MSISIFTLKNGIRVIHQEVPYGQIGHCGYIINVGSRDESEDELGMAHFIEHTLFKGTTKRRAFHVLNRMDAVGGEINAYTTKEETCVYASFVNNHYERALELLTDIVFNATFPEKEIEKEKDVILDEINAYLDDPSETIFDEFDEMIFKGHSLGKSILGSEKLIKGFTREKVKKFVKKHYTTDEIVFASVAPLSAKKVKKYFEKFIDDIPATRSTKKRPVYKGYHMQDITRKKDTHQVHKLIGNVAYASGDEKRRALILLNNVLGGPGLNSRLNLNIREKYGYTYYLESGYTPYSDTGMFNIYFGTDRKQLNKTAELVLKELKGLRQKKLGINQLHSAKQQLIGQLALSQENKVSMMLAIGKSLLLYDTVDTMDVVYQKIEQLTAEELQDVANEIFDEDKLSSLTYLSK